MHNNDERLAETLKSNGFSLTNTRKLIFAQLHRQEPQSMRELVQNCEAIDRASVYRSVMLFEKLGIIQRFQIGWKYKLELSDQYAPHHHHANCVNCGQITALPEDKQLEERLLKLARQQGFTPQDHQIEIRGLCPTCQKSKEKIKRSDASTFVKT